MTGLGVVSALGPDRHAFREALQSGRHGFSPLVGEDWPDVPLVGGRQRFARLKPIFADTRLPASRPQAYRD